MLVEVWSDVACPWCLKGKRRLEAALEQFEHRDAGWGALAVVRAPTGRAAGHEHV